MSLQAIRPPEQLALCDHTLVGPAGWPKCIVEPAGKVLAEQKSRLDLGIDPAQAGVGSGFGNQTGLRLLLPPPAASIAHTFWLVPDPWIGPREEQARL